MDSVLESLLKHDTNFSESKFKSKVENYFVQIQLSMVTGKIEKIHHLVNDATFEKIKSKVQEDIKNNRIQIFDELNVANVQIVNVEEDNDCFKIEAQIFSKSLEYYIDKNTKEYLSGNNQSRTNKCTFITLKKEKNAKDLNIVRKCPSCGANIDINTNGQCKYCHRIFDLEKYDWIVTNLEI